MCWLFPQSKMKFADIGEAFASIVKHLDAEHFHME